MSSLEDLSEDGVDATSAEEEITAEEIEEAATDRDDISPIFCLTSNHNLVFLS
jgi:hypothetical protein